MSLFGHFLKDVLNILRKEVINGAYLIQDKETSLHILSQIILNVR